LNRPELTRDRFIPNPLPEYGKDKRLYRTGDLARYRADGSIECLGRIDHQVKLRGFRIELGEIEAVMSRHDGVRQGVVVADGGPGDRRLVAYFEREAGRTVDAEALRAHLRASLPDYMIPSIFVPLDKIPLTANGKIDRRALPSPGEHLSARPAPAPPRDTLEQMLSRLWCKVLKLPSVGIHDNFFELGGHSILAVRVLIEVEKASGTRLPLATLLQAPTIAGLADVLRRQNWQPSWTSLVPIRSGGSGIPLFLMHSHGGNVLEYYPLANVLDEEFPIYALQARGLDGKIAAGQSMQQMAARYIEEMRALQPEGPYFLGGFCFGGLLALEAAQQLTAAGEEVALVVMIQTTHPAVNHFTPETNAFERMKYRLAKRLDLERQNLRNGGKSYFMERARRVWDIMRARVEIGWDALIGRGNRSAANRSLPYILEALSIEHDKVYWQYVPAAYRGKVLLIRAATQLRGLAADSTSLGWKDVFGGGLDVREVEGHQQNMLIAPNVRRVGEILTDHVRAAMTRYAKRNTDAA
jgi:thioesterase domain-containing protein